MGSDSMLDLESDPICSPHGARDGAFSPSLRYRLSCADALGLPASEPPLQPTSIATLSESGYASMARATAGGGVQDAATVERWIARFMTDAMSAYASAHAVRNSGVNRGPSVSARAQSKASPTLSK